MNIQPINSLRDLGSIARYIHEWNGKYLIESDNTLLFPYDDEARYEENIYLPFFLFKITPVYIVKESFCKTGDIGYCRRTGATYIYSGKIWMKLSHE